MERLVVSGEGRNYEPVGHNRPDSPGRHWSSTSGAQGLAQRKIGEKRT